MISVPSLLSVETVQALGTHLAEANGVGPLSWLFQGEAG